ncbi:hypothetical protein [Microbacterium sp. JZ31]|uniref:hypothetical protein n=1 Tax=Microbacterium sp. JZ31 TaxID=1906274 RepID=UPI001931ECC9|nr:hypothetical protein [Microbacterium sp. JZ31]
MPVSLRASLARLNDTRSIEHGVVWTAANGLLMLIDPRTLTPRGRLLYRGAMAVLGAWTAWATMRTDARDEIAPAARGGYSVGAAGLMMAASEVTEGLDARIHDAIARRGAARPRVAMALGSAVLAAGTWFAGLRSPAAQADGFAEEADDRPETIPVPADVRALVELLLGATDGFGAQELRAQLAAAEAVGFEGPEPEGFWPGIGFEVPDGMPAAVPGDANFPVVGCFSALDGRTFELYLTVLGGRLSTLSVSEGRAWTDDEQMAWMEAGRGVHELPAWPAPADLELLIETPSGLTPVSA